MEKEQRLYIYAFLSRIMADEPDTRMISDLSKNTEFLEMIGADTAQWFKTTDLDTIKLALNGDFSSMFLLNTQAIESFVLDAKNESLVGLQNPVMMFYYENGFELNMDQTRLNAPDHLSIEFAFMQTLVFRDELAPQGEFLKRHLVMWVIPYMLGMKSMAETPFYSDLCDFIVEFLAADLEYLSEGE